MTVEGNRSAYAQKLWLKNYPPQVDPSLNYPDAPLTYFLAESARKFPQQKATNFFGATLTYADLWQEVQRFASFLGRLEIKKGDRVALVLPNCPQAVIAYYAALSLGAVVVQHNPLYVERELEFQLKDSGAGTVVVLDLLYPRVARVRPGTEIKNVIVTALQDYMPFAVRTVFSLKLRWERKSVKVKQGPGLHLWAEIMAQAWGLTKNQKSNRLTWL